MKKRVADIVAQTLVDLGVTECFCVVGGGAMHLNNAFELNSDMHVTFCHHEQACAFAAEGFAKYSGGIAAVSVTSGPGCMNTLNGVYSAWVDSTPMIVIAGHPRLDTTVEACGLNLRCRGVQEYNMIPAVEGMTKYATMITDPDMAGSEVRKAYRIAMEGRRGPVWISIPLDIQAALTEEQNISYPYTDEGSTVDHQIIKEIVEKIRAASKPCILTGSGLRYGNAMEEFLEFTQRVEIPVVGGALLADTLPENFPYFYGLSGNIGPRTGNYILQNADLILVLGNSLSTRQTGFNVEGFAPNAYFIMVDAEKDEPLKPGLHIDLAVQMDVKRFLKYACDTVQEKIRADKFWVSYCEKVSNFFKGYDEPEYREEDRIPAKLFWKIFREMLPDDAAIALGNSNCVIGLYQYGIKKMGQRVITNYNAGSMGYDLPEAVGVAVASGKTVYCVTGDGSVMMNLQELATIRHNKLPVKIIIFSNEGYGAIRQTCKNYFKGVYTGCDAESGIGFPGFKEIAKAFGFNYMHCRNCGELKENLEGFLAAPDLVLLEIDQALDDTVLPKIMSKIGADGKFETPGFTDLYPYISDADTKKLMISQE